MKRKLISSGSTFEEKIGYSRAVLQGDWIFVSGITGYNYETMTISKSITEQTEQCLLNIKNILEQADRYYSLIIEEIEFVADNFMTGKSAEQTRKNYRVSKIKSHLIFYRKKEKDIIGIVRILHQRMNIKKRLS